MAGAGEVGRPPGALGGCVRSVRGSGAGVLVWAGGVFHPPTAVGGSTGSTGSTGSVGSAGTTGFDGCVDSTGEMEGTGAPPMGGRGLAWVWG